MRIRGKIVNFSSKVINEIYGLVDVDPRLLMAKDYAPGSGLVSQLYPRREVPWASIKIGIYLNKFSAKVQIFFTISVAVTL